LSIFFKSAGNSDVFHTGEIRGHLPFEDIGRSERGGRVLFHQSKSHGVPKNLIGILQRSAGHICGAAIFNLRDQAGDLGWLDDGDRTIANAAQNVFPETHLGVPGVTLDLADSPFLKPPGSNLAKGINHLSARLCVRDAPEFQCSFFLRFPLLHWIGST
jgi:hypothetical protein